MKRVTLCGSSASAVAAAAEYNCEHQNQDPDVAVVEQIAKAAHKHPPLKVSALSPL
jgi:hypothetical protein